MSQEQDRIFFRNYTIVIVLIAIAMVVFFFIAQAVGTDDKLAADRAAKLSERQASQAMEDTAPMSEVSVQGEEEAAAGGEEEVAAAGGAKSGEEVYNGMCVACHSVPGIGAPVVGNAEDWADRIAKGNDTLIRKRDQRFYRA